MNLPATTFFLLLSAASAHTAETPPEAQAPTRSVVPGKTGKTYAEGTHAKPEKEALASVLPPFVARYSWFWPFRKATDKEKDAGGCPQPAIQEKTWEACMAEARVKLGKGGGYACTGKALGNFIQAFSWNEKRALPSVLPPFMAHCSWPWTSGTPGGEKTAWTAMPGRPWPPEKPRTARGPGAAPMPTAPAWPS